MRVLTKGLHADNVRWLYLMIALVVALLRLPTLTNRILSIDEASYLVHALRLNSLETFLFAFFYRAETKTQIGLLPYTLANAIDRSNAILLIHVLGLIAAVVGCWLLIAIAGRFLSASIAGFAAGVMWAIYLVVGPGHPEPENLDGYTFFQAVRLEYFQVPFLLLALYLFLLCVTGTGRVGRKQATLVFVAGLAWSVATLIKPSTALFGFPLLLWLAALPVFASKLKTGRLRRLKLGGALLVGAALPVAIVFAPYLFHPAGIDVLRFSFTELSSNYMEKGDLKVRTLELLTGVSPVALAAFALLFSITLIGAVMRRHHPQLGEPLRVLALAGILAGVLFLSVVPGQAHVYYLVPVIPFIALTIAGATTLVLRHLPSRAPKALIWSIALTIAAGYVGQHAEALSKYPERTLHDAYLARDRKRFDLDALVTYIKTTTPPGGTMWVYYNTPELFVLSERSPVTIDPAGIWLDYIWTETWFKRITNDLAAERPHLVIGIDRPRYHYPHTVPLLEVPILGEWVRNNHTCDTSSIRGAVVCRRP